MVKCVVSGCPNREVNVSASLGIFNRPPKRFFSFPKDPARVKVWLAALRETDKQNSREEHLICEDHFLPEDITANGVNGDAIPIMPQCLDGSLGMMSSWGAEPSDEEDQWATGGGDEEEEEEDDAYGGVCAGFANVVAPVRDPPAPEPPAPEPPAPEPPSQQDSSPPKISGTKTTGDGLQQSEDVDWTKRDTKKEVSLCTLVKHFLEMMLAAPDGLLDARQVLASLQTCQQRISDITNVLLGINLIEREAAHRFKWTGACHISSFLWKNEQVLQRELDNMELVEDTLDRLIRSCAEQLFDMTDDTENAALAYVTHEDFSRLSVLQGQTLFVVKAPEGTNLKVPAPETDNIQIHLKAEKPITVLTCDVGTEDTSGETSGCFLTLEESRIKTAVLHTESSMERCAERIATS